MKYQYILTYGAESETLTHNPQGWDKLGITYARHEVYHSVLRNFTTNLQFARITGGGADFIISAYESEGIAANVIITINRKNPNTGGYDLFFSGNLDLKTMSITREYLSCAIMDGMKLQRLISRDEINFDLFSLSSADNITITDFSGTPSISFTPIDIQLLSNGVFYYDIVNKSIGSEEDQFIDVDTATYITNEIGSRLNFENTQDIYTNTTTEEVILNLNFSGNIRRWGSVKTGQDYSVLHFVFSIIVYDKNLNKLSEDIILFENFDDLPSSGGTSFDKTSLVSYNKNLTIPVGGIINFNYLAQAFTGIEDTTYNINGGLSFNIKEYSPGQTLTSSDCLFAHEAFTRLIQHCTSETDTAKLLRSEYFGKPTSNFQTYSEVGTGANDIIFNGYMVRNYPNYKLNCNFRDLFKSFDAIYNLGLGYDKANDRFYIEQKPEFYKSSYLMFDLGEVADLKITPAMKHYFSKITCGYNIDGEYNDFMGAYEFNTKREYSLSVPVKEERVLQSVYRGDSLGVELARRKQYSENASLDTDYDNEVFIVRTDGTAPVLGESYTGFPGIEQYYNTMLSPRENLKRWGSVILASCFKNSNPVKYQASGKTISMQKDGVNELSDIQLTELGVALFKPEIYQFKSYVNSTIISILNEDPHGFIRFSYEGAVYEGYLLNLESGDFNKEATYELIAKEVVSGNDFIFEDGEDFVFEDGNDYIYES